MTHHQEHKQYLIAELCLIHEGLHDIRLTTEGIFTYASQKSYFRISNGAPIASRMVMSPAETRYAICKAMMDAFTKEAHAKQRILQQRIMKSARVEKDHLHAAEKNFMYEMSKVSALFRKNITTLMVTPSPHADRKCLDGDALRQVLHHYHAAMTALRRRSQWASRRLENASSHPA